MSHPTPDQILTFTLQCAKDAGDLIKHYRAEEDLNVSVKQGAVDLVTSADLAAEKLILDRIRTEFPEHQILSEETAPKIDDLRSDDSPVWIVDPIDGTNNYAHSHYQVGVSIAYADKQKIQVGVVHCPFLEETFHAVRDQGAFLNDKKITINRTKDLQSALIGTGFPYSREEIIDTILMNLRAILLNCRGIRRLGSAALDICWLACGRLDGFYEFRLSPWDIAAASLIAVEAGAEYGSVAELDDLSRPIYLNSSDVLVATPRIYDELRSILKSI